jgi:hypothetical protein
MALRTVNPVFLLWHNNPCELLSKAQRKAKLCSSTETSGNMLLEHRLVREGLRRELHRKYKRENEDAFHY